MANDFNALVGDDFVVAPANQQSRHHSTNESESVGGPKWLLAVIAVELVVSLVCLLPATKPMHVVGYVVGALVVAVTAIAYRTIEKRRSIAPNFVAQFWPGRTVAAGLALGILIAAIHAFYLAQKVTVRR